MLNADCVIPQRSSLNPYSSWFYISNLFADGTHLMLSDKNLRSLEKRINTQLHNTVELWLKKKYL